MQTLHEKVLSVQEALPSAPSEEKVLSRKKKCKICAALLVVSLVGAIIGSIISNNGVSISNFLVALFGLMGAIGLYGGIGCYIAYNSANKKYTAEKETYLAECKRIAKKNKDKSMDLLRQEMETNKSRIASLQIELEKQQGHITEVESFSALFSGLGKQNDEPIFENQKKFFVELKQSIEECRNYEKEIEAEIKSLGDS